MKTLMNSKLASTGIVVLTYALIAHALPRPNLAPLVESRAIVEYASNISSEECPSECAQYMKIYNHTQPNAVSLCEGQCKQTGTIEWALAWDEESSSNSTSRPVPLAKTEPESKIVPESSVE